MDGIYYGVFFVLIVAIGFLFKQAMTKDNPRPSKMQSQVLSSSTPKQGVQVDVLQMGEGSPAKSGDHVEVHYVASLTNGKVVDSSYEKGGSFKFQMGRRQVIPGWEAGMMGMKVGEKRKFTIAPEQAYGKKGKANVPPNATIVFEVDLIAKR